MRHGLIALAPLLLACASAAPPPGGPEDKAPPILVRVTPDTNAVNVRNKVVSFYFDETINDRGTGAQEIDQFFLVSPSDGEARVSWHRGRIDVSPRRDFRANTAYTVTMLPGLADLRNNVMKSGIAVTFSTGPTIPSLRITGTVFDWVAERPATRAYVEAITSDSITYLAESDTLGKFSIGPLIPGTYLVRGLIDQNRNRIIDRNEAYDSVRVTAPQSAPVELLAAPRDTLPGRILTVAVADSVTLRVTFDRLLDPTQKVPVTAYRLVSADSSVVALASVLTPREEAEAARISQLALADSIRRADSLAGKPVAPSPTPTPDASPRGRAGAPEIVIPKPSLPPPYSTVTIRLTRPLPPNTAYRLSVSGIRGLSGRTQPSDRSFTTPKAVPPPKPTADSSRTVKPPADSSRTTRPPVDSARTVKPPPTLPTRVPISARTSS